jgi:hypothetical protein
MTPNSVSNNLLSANVDAIPNGSPITLSLGYQSTTTTYKWIRTTSASVEYSVELRDVPSCQGLIVLPSLIAPVTFHHQTAAHRATEKPASLSYVHRLNLPAYLDDDQLRSLAHGHLPDLLNASVLMVPTGTIPYEISLASLSPGKSHLFQDRTAYLRYLAELNVGIRERVDANNSYLLKKASVVNRRSRQSQHTFIFSLDGRPL